MKKSNQPIDCHLHDHLEVACLYGYELDVSLRNGTTIAARAVTTKTKNGEEYLVTRLRTGEQDIPMGEIASVIVRTKNAAFSKLDF